MSFGLALHVWFSHRVSWHIQLQQGRLDAEYPTVRRDDAKWKRKCSMQCQWRLRTSVHSLGSSNLGVWGVWGFVQLRKGCYKLWILQIKTLKWILWWAMSLHWTDNRHLDPATCGRLYGLQVSRMRQDLPLVWSYRSHVSVLLLYAMLYIYAFHQIKNLNISI